MGGAELNIYVACNIYSVLFLVKQNADIYSIYI